MKKIFFALLVTLALTSCGTTALYNWNKYEDASYLYYKQQTPESTEALLKAYEKMMERPIGSRKVVPPGVYAEYGYLLVKAGKQSEGLEFLNKEVQTYPEAKVFIERIIKQLEQ